MNSTRDYGLLLVCEKKANAACISVYNLHKLNFNSVTINKPKRKVITTLYNSFKYASFSQDGNYLVSLGSVYGNTIQGVIWDVQIFQAYQDDNYRV
jgi:hypothetical protein